MLIDEVKITVSAGDGGKGSVSFNKNRMELGPTGGSGGKGGSVYFEGVSNLGALNQFRFKKEVKAEDGKDGRGQFRDGPDGKDLIVKVPVGTVVKNNNDNTEEEIVSVGQKILIAKGGRGGKGNFLFRSSTNTSPRQFQEGKKGEQFEIDLELKMIADIGFVGLPNVGKSSLLNELTNAQSKVANYRFTTLEPHLGVYQNLILADIPGIITGASEGKGLGFKFLKHIERTKIIFHFISAESTNPSEDYKIIKSELENYSDSFSQKPEYILISKSDLVDEKILQDKMGELEKISKHVYPISIHDYEKMKNLEKLLGRIIDEKIKKSA